MNIAFFLTPKTEVVYEKVTSTMRQVLERMEYHRYTAIPILDEKGKYIGTLTEGDLLWKLKYTPSLGFKDTNKISISEVPRRTKIKAVRIDSNIEDLISASIHQNYIPVVDDNNTFIGIIKRSDIISYCYERIFQNASVEV